MNVLHINNEHLMSNISDYTSLIRHWSGILSRRQSLISILFKDKKLLSIVQSYIDGKAKQVIDESFNIFEIISDRYYLENFHSNLIAFFLSPNSNHHYGKTGLKLFFDLLNNIRPGCISYFNYSYAEISTEAPLPGGRIDILIKDEISKHAVVIENKINNASDMPRQIPRYCDFLEKEVRTL